MDDHFIQLRVVYSDPPDLMELEAQVQYGGWAARSIAYASPHVFSEDCQRLLEWSKAPSTPFTIEAGADTGIGWLKLVFYQVDRIGHVACSVTLATGQHVREARLEETWRMQIEIRTEPGLIERFARACILLGQKPDCEAKLVGIPN